MAAHAVHMGYRSACRIFVGRYEGKGPLGRPRPRWVDNIRIYLRELGWRYELDSSSSGWRLVAGSCGHRSVPSYSVKCWEFCQGMCDIWFLKDCNPWR